MPYVQSDAAVIHYEVEGEGPPLILQHGFTDDMNVWKDRGYTDALRRGNRLVLINARGHGRSEKPHEPAAYTPESHVADVLAVLDELGLATSRYYGYSMGAIIGFALAKHAPERFTSMILGGSHPYPLPPAPSDPLIELLQQGPEGLLTIYEEFITPEKKARLLASDMEALIAWRTNRLTGFAFPEIVETMPMRCFLYAGSADPVHDKVRETAAKMPRAEFYSVPDLTHVQTQYRSELILPKVQEFLQSDA
jgi:pimeloyl-ACP methyl ester carboxylesterase